MACARDLSNFSPILNLLAVALTSIKILKILASTKMSTEPQKKKRKQQHNGEAGEEDGKTTARAAFREQNASDPTMMPKVHHKVL